MLIKGKTGCTKDIIEIVLQENVDCKRHELCKF